MFQNLNAASSNLNTFFHDLVPFAHESVPSLKSLGSAVRGRQAGGQGGDVRRSRTSTSSRSRRPSSPRTSRSCSHALDTHQRSASAGGPVEPDPRSPNGGKGYSGLEGLLEYVFNITNAIDYYGPWGHMLGVDAFAELDVLQLRDAGHDRQGDPAIPAAGGNLNANNPMNPRTCYAFLGPNQPGVNEADPSWNAKDATPANPSACVPDPGGYPTPGIRHPLPGPEHERLQARFRRPCRRPTSRAPSWRGRRGPGAVSTSGASGGRRRRWQLGRRRAAPAARRARSSVGQTIPGMLGCIGIGRTGSPIQAATGAVDQATGGSGAPANGGQAQQLLNYLLAP